MMVTADAPAVLRAIRPLPGERDKLDFRRI